MKLCHKMLHHLVFNSGSSNKYMSSNHRSRSIWMQIAPPLFGQKVPHLLQQKLTQNTNMEDSR